MPATDLTAEILTNMALSYLRADANPVTDLSTDTSRVGTLANLWLPRVTRFELMSHPWTFATKYTLLTLADDGTDEDWNDSGDWKYAYEAPSDMLVGRYFAKGFKDQTPCPYPWRPGVHDGDPVIFTDVAEADAYFVYTYENETYAQWPDTFGEAVALSLAVRIGGPLLVDNRVTSYVQQQYRAAWSRAAAVDGNGLDEGEPPTCDLLASRY